MAVENLETIGVLVKHYGYAAIKEKRFLDSQKLLEVIARASEALDYESPIIRRWPLDTITMAKARPSTDAARILADIFGLADDNLEVFLLAAEKELQNDELKTPIIRGTYGEETPSQPRLEAISKSVAEAIESVTGRPLPKKEPDEETAPANNANPIEPSPATITPIPEPASIPDAPKPVDPPQALPNLGQLRGRQREAIGQARQAMLALRPYNIQSAEGIGMKLLHVLVDASEIMNARDSSDNGARNLGGVLPLPVYHKLKAQADSAIIVEHLSEERRALALSEAIVIETRLMLEAECLLLGIPPQMQDQLAAARGQERYKLGNDQQEKLLRWANALGISPASLVAISARIQGTTFMDFLKTNSIRPSVVEALDGRGTRPPLQTIDRIAACIGITGVQSVLAFRAMVERYQPFPKQEAAIAETQVQTPPAAPPEIPVTPNMVAVEAIVTPVVTTSAMVPPVESGPAEDELAVPTTSPSPSKPRANGSVSQSNTISEADALGAIAKAKESYKKMEPYTLEEANKIALQLYQDLSFTRHQLSAAGIGSSATIAKWRKGDIKLDSMMPVCRGLIGSIIRDEKTAKEASYYLTGIPWSEEKTPSQLMAFATKHNLDPATYVVLARRQLFQNHGEFAETIAAGKLAGELGAPMEFAQRDLSRIAAPRKEDIKERGRSVKNFHKVVTNLGLVDDDRMLFYKMVFSDIHQYPAVTREDLVYFYLQRSGAMERHEFFRQFSDQLLHAIYGSDIGDIRDEIIEHQIIKARAKGEPIEVDNLSVVLKTSLDNMRKPKGWGSNRMPDDLAEWTAEFVFPEKKFPGQEYDELRGSFAKYLSTPEAFRAPTHLGNLIREPASRRRS